MHVRIAVRDTTRSASTLMHPSHPRCANANSITRFPACQR
jgi:hypothetical protein